MAVAPLSHHEIIGLVEPYTRRGRHVDLAASQRMERRLAFKPIAHASESGALQGLTETLLLENPRPGRHRLTRTLTLPDGLQATLQAEGADAGQLLARIEAVAPQQQFAAGSGYTLARSYRLDDGDRDTGAHRVLTAASARLEGLRLQLGVSSVRGIPGEFELTPIAGRDGTDGDRLADLPEDLLAVLGWSWSRLQRARDGWTCVLRLRGSDAARSADAEAKFDATVQHLARTLAEPPARFHERLAGARWKVVLRRATPLLVTLALFAGAAAVPRLALQQDSVLRMLIFHAPPLLLVVFFCLREMPRIELPPLPRASSASSWLRPQDPSS